MFRVFAAVLLWLSLLGHASHAADWQEFRGPGGGGVSGETNLPLKWSADSNIKWRVALPFQGNGSPIVTKGLVLVTVGSQDGTKRSLYCYDRKDGALQWFRSVKYSEKLPTHYTNLYAGTTPAADGERIVVWHSSAGLFCYDYQGNELWKRDLGRFQHVWGFGASPIIHEDQVILNAGPGKRTILYAFDKLTGATLWEAPEPGGDDGLEKRGKERALWIGSWSTPMIASVGGSDQIVVSFPNHVKGYDPSNGQVLWSCDGLGDLVYTSPIIVGDVCVAMGGFHGPAIGFKLGGSGNVTDSNRIWRIAQRNPQRIGSGVAVGKHIFIANADKAGTVQCLELATGKEVWKDRPPRSAPSWGSTIHVDGRLYVTNQNGVTIVLAPSPEKMEVLAVNALDETCNSTPAFSDGEIFIRTFEALYCIADDG